MGCLQTNKAACKGDVATQGDTGCSGRGRQWSVSHDSQAHSTLPTLDSLLQKYHSVVHEYLKKYSFQNVKHICRSMNNESLSKNNIFNDDWSTFIGSRWTIYNSSGHTGFLNPSR